MQSSAAITSTDFVLDERGALTRILGALRSDATEELYAYGPEGVAAQRTIVGGTPQDVLYPLLDGLGSVRHLTDASGALVLSRHYDAWGTIRHSSGSASTRLGFTGELVDGATGLVYLRARHYSPALGRFLQRDSFPGIPERPQSLNRFAYTENNPANWTDPSGKLVFIPVLLAAWMVVEIGLQIYDTYDTIRTVADPCVSGWEKGAVVGMYVAGLFLPGGGYGTATRQGFRWFRHADEAADVAETSYKLLRQTDEAAALASKGDDAEALVKAAKRCLLNSFSAGTLVSTADGLRPISEIRIGDLVLAYDEATRNTGLFTVTAVLVHLDPAQVHLTIGGEPVETTPEHPFFTLERGWVDAGDLWRGAHVRQADGSFDTVWSVAVETEPQVMYNLTVAQAHTFFVGTGRWLVHNAPICKVLGRIGREAFGETRFRGLVGGQSLRDLTHHQILHAFESTPFKLSNHAIMRLKDIRTYNIGITTLDDVARVLNKGIVEEAGRGLISITDGGFEAIINPATKIIVTFSPH